MNVRLAVERNVVAGDHRGLPFSDRGAGDRLARPPPANTRLPERPPNAASFPQVTAVARLLGTAHPDTNLGNLRDPLEELFFIILSGQTTERLFTRTFRRLKRRFRDWNQLGSAPTRTIAAAIRRGGLAHQKARFLRAIARRLRNDFGKVTLSPLGKMPTEQAEAYLRSLPGVGVKTARCVLVYSLNREVFPFDIHCIRVMSRLGWLNWSGQRAELLADSAQAGVPPKLRKLLHIRFVQHGRAICKSTPSCDACVLRKLCPSAPYFTRGEDDA